MRRQHHESAINLAGFCITIAPVVTIMAQGAVAKMRRKKRGGK